MVGAERSLVEIDMVVSTIGVRGRFTEDGSKEHSHHHVGSVREHTIRRIRMTVGLA